MRTVYTESKYFCGRDYLSVYLYPTFRPAAGRAKKEKPTSQTQAKLNAWHAEEKLYRKVHHNFTDEDYAIGLDCRDDVLPQTFDEAFNMLKNYLRRIRRYRKKNGLPPLKYIAVIEQGKKSGRYHYHVILNGGIDRDTLEEMWGHGRANTRRLQFNEKGVSGLTHYVGKNPVGPKRWYASKGLTDPMPKKRNGRISAKKARELEADLTNNRMFEELYPGWLLAEATRYNYRDLEPDDMERGEDMLYKPGGVYLCIRMYRADSSFMKKRRGGRRE